MKNYEDPKKLAHLRKVQAARREAAEARKAQQILRNRHAVSRVAGGAK